MADGSYTGRDLERQATKQPLSRRELIRFSIVVFVQADLSVDAKVRGTSELRVSAVSLGQFALGELPSDAVSHPRHPLRRPVVIDWCGSWLRANLIRSSIPFHFYWTLFFSVVRGSGAGLAELNWRGARGRMTWKDRPTGPNGSEHRSRSGCWVDESAEDASTGSRQLRHVPTLDCAESYPGLSTTSKARRSGLCLMYLKLNGPIPQLSISVPLSLASTTMERNPSRSLRAEGGRG